MKKPIEDEFKGDNAHLCECIKALIELSDDNALVPHGLGGHARGMLAACYRRLSAEPSALGMIAGERARQKHRGFTAEHDDEHRDGELASAAVAYAWSNPDMWPFEPESWHPSEDPIRDRVKAGAFIVAEIERLGRLGENVDVVAPATGSATPTQGKGF